MYYKYFFFDFDGMLCDTYAHITSAFVTALNDLRSEKISEKEAFNYLKVSFNEAFKHYNVTEEEKLLFKHYHDDINFKPTSQLFLPVKKILKSIIASGGKNFIYTNRYETLFEYYKKSSEYSEDL